MMETIRRCIACILPCGILDVVRVVHANGRVQEFTDIVTAADVMQQHPKHVLREPPSSSFEGSDGGCRDAVILPPEAALKRGSIYFLVPVSSSSVNAREKAPTPASWRRRRKRREVEYVNGAGCDTERLLVSDQYLTEILSEKVSTRRRRDGVWRPHLESISEVDL